MLINGRYAEELRMAIIDGETLLSYKVQVKEAGSARGNVYRGVVANVESSLDAAFIDYGVEKHGFLASHDVIEQAYQRTRRSGGAPRIEEVLQKGQPILVQVTKDAMGTKGAVLTTNISLAGRYLVLMPFDTSCGMSRKVEDEATRKTLKDKVKSLVAAEGYGFIVRTNAVEQTKTALKADLDALVRLWQRVLAARDEGRGARLLHDDQDLVVQALRDHLDASIDEVLVDDEALLAQAQEYVAATMPKSKVALTLYRERIPLFSRHGLEPKVAAIHKRIVALPSGGSIVIDPTEALTAIDVNSGKSTGAASQDETARATNLEAAVEVARQLRLRDIGGLVVVDFIDMRSTRHGKEVEKALREAMKVDKARSKVGRISANGLLEINRQRVGQALQLRTHNPCPTCQGVGRLVAPELLGLQLLRRIEAAAATGRLQRARITMHPQLALEVQNRRRRQLAALENDYRIEIELVADANLAMSEERTQWFNRDTPAEAVARDERDAGREGRGDQRREGGERRGPSGEGGGDAQTPGRKRSRKRRSRGDRASEAAAQDGSAPSEGSAEAAVVETAAAQAPAEVAPAGEVRPWAAEAEREADRSDERELEEDRASGAAPDREGPDEEPWGEELHDEGSAEAPAATGEERPRRRRRRRGRRPGEPGQPRPADARPDPAPPQTATPAPQPGRDDPGRRRRRRRGGRRRKGGSSGNGGAVE
jgi:ribonuclease E